MTKKEAAKAAAKAAAKTEAKTEAWAMELRTKRTDTGLCEDCGAEIVIRVVDLLKTRITGMDTIFQIVLCEKCAEYEREIANEEEQNNRGGSGTVD